MPKATEYLKRNYLVKLNEGEFKDYAGNIINVDKINNRIKIVIKKAWKDVDTIVFNDWIDAEKVRLISTDLN